LQAAATTLVKDTLGGLDGPSESLQLDDGPYQTLYDQWFQVADADGDGKASRPCSDETASK
jgi:hypothetical protein